MLVNSYKRTNLSEFVHVLPSVFRDAELLRTIRIRTVSARVSRPHGSSGEALHGRYFVRVIREHCEQLGDYQQVVELGLRVQ
jgi:hypothetical protein